MTRDAALGLHEGFTELTIQATGRPRWFSRLHGNEALVRGSGQAAGRSESQVSLPFRALAYSSSPSVQMLMSSLLFKTRAKPRRNVRMVDSWA